MGFYIKGDDAIIWIIGIIILIGLYFLLRKKGNGIIPEPEPEPNNPKWEDYYPKNWYKPLVDWNKKKWIPSNHNSKEWDNYVIQVNLWNETLEKLSIKKGEISDRKLYLILFQKKDNGEYLFRWNSDMQIWGQKDHWAPPELFLILKDENGNPDPDGKYRDDCDTFSRFHNQYLFESCKYWLSLFLEIYWKKKVLVQVGDKLIEKWNSYGHAITVYKKDSESNWKCFSNQSWVASLSGEDELMKIVYKFVPIDNPQFADRYQLIKVVARHPINGELLFELKGDDLDV